MCEQFRIFRPVIRRRTVLSSSFFLFAGCAELGEFQGATLEVVLTKPVADDTPITPVDETELLSFEIVQRSLQQASDIREEIIDEHYNEDEYSEAEPWQYAAVIEPLDENTYRAVESELTSHPKHEPEGKSSSERFFRYKGDDYILRTVVAD